jgi:hypothetical protein
LCFAQDVKADFKKINEVYNTTPAFSMEIKYELFFDNAIKPYEKEIGKYAKLNSNYYTLQAGSEVVMTDNYMFLIDKNTKILAMDKKIDANKIVNPLSINLDSLYLLYSKIEELKVNSSGRKGYRFYVKEGPYSMCDVYFDTKTNFVTEIRNVFRKKMPDENDKLHSAVLKTTFYNYSTNQALFSAIFNDLKYVKKNKEKFVLSENYKTYKFINHLN